MFNNMEIVNNNANSDAYNKSEMPVKVEVSSISQILSTVSQMMSMCTMCSIHIKSANTLELSQCLPHFQIILSEMNEMVALTLQQQQQNSEEWNKIISSTDSSSTDLSSSSLSSDASLEDSSVGDLFVSRMTGTIDYIAPNNVFNKKRSKKMKKRMILQRVPKVLRAIWDNCDKIFCQASGPGQQEVRSPTIDWTKVNVRALANIPTPQACPIYSCSQDPEFYQSSKWTMCNPFGWEYGYNTQLGTVLVTSEPVHGYIWDVQLQQWILHASFQPEKEREKAKSKSRVQFFKQRKIKGKQHTHQKKRING